MHPLLTSGLTLAVVALATIFVALGWPPLLGHFEPMQPLTAVCLALLAIAVPLDRRRLVLPIAGAVAIVAGLTIAQHVTHLDLGVDRWLPIAPSVAPSPHPGRIAATTAIALFVIAAALIERWRADGPFGALCGAAAATLGAYGVLVGALRDPVVLDWGEVTRSSPLSGVAALVLGGWLVRAPSAVRPTRGALAGVVVGTMLAITAWHALFESRGRWMRDVTLATSETTAEVVAEGLVGRAATLTSMADAWSDDAPPIATWEEDAARVFVLYPSFEAIGWVLAGEIRWWRPGPGRRDAGGLPADVLPLVAAIVEPSQVISLPGAGRYVLGVPVIGAEGPVGHLVGLLEAPVLVASVVPQEVQRDFAVTLRLEEEPEPDVAAALGQHTIRQELDAVGARWVLTVRPRRAWMENVRTGMPEVFLVLGVGLALTGGVSLQLGAEAARRSRELARANEALRAEITAHEEARRALAASHDELEQRVVERTEALRRANVELERSNRELDHFASVASHDLKEPLRTARLYVQMLGRRMAPEDAVARDRMDRATRSLDRMAGIIDALLGYARLGIDRRPVAVALEPVVDDVIASLQATTSELGARIDVARPLPPVTADPGQLARVFQNLINNALKYRSEAPPRIAISAARHGDEVRIEVRDNGRGIAPERQESVFSLFGRAHEADDVPGVGIGLAVCKAIVEHHGGRMGVDSVVGEGSTFWFTLPPA